MRRDGGRGGGQRHAVPAGDGARGPTAPLRRIGSGASSVGDRGDRAQDPRSLAAPARAVYAAAARAGMGASVNRPRGGGRRVEELVVFPLAAGAFGARDLPLRSPHGGPSDAMAQDRWHVLPVRGEGDDVGMPYPWPRRIHARQLRHLWGHTRPAGGQDGPANAHALAIVVPHDSDAAARCASGTVRRCCERGASGRAGRREEADRARHRGAHAKDRWRLGERHRRHRAFQLPAHDRPARVRSTRSGVTAQRVLALLGG